MSPNINSMFASFGAWKGKKEGENLFPVDQQKTAN